MTSETSDSSKPESITSLSGCLLRCYWMLAGHPLILMFLGLAVLDQRRAVGSLDVAYAVAVILVVLARALDTPYVRPSKGVFTGLTVGIAAALWATVRGLGVLWSGGS